LFLLLPPPPSPTLFPYTTLFRSTHFGVPIRPDIDEQLEVPQRQSSERRRRILREHDYFADAFAGFGRYRERRWIVRGQRQRWERSEEHTSELQSLRHLVCRLLLE